MRGKKVARWGEQVFAFEASSRNDEVEVLLDNEETPQTFRIEKQLDHLYEVCSTSQGPSMNVRAIRTGNTVWISSNGETYRIDIEDVRRGRSAAASHAEEIRAPMTGTVLRVIGAVGNTVEAGDAILVVEAMKMEHTLRAPRAGTIQTINCAEGESVEAQAVLVTFDFESD